MGLLLLQIVASEVPRWDEWLHQHPKSFGETLAKDIVAISQLIVVDGIRLNLRYEVLEVAEVLHDFEDSQRSHVVH